MKKVLALLLSVIMLFGALSVGATAINIDSVRADAGLIPSQVILSFNLNSGTIKNGVTVYDYETKTFIYDDNYLDNMYYMIPDNSLVVDGKYSQLPTSVVNLPAVNPPSGYVFNGWYCYATNETYPGNRGFTIPSDAAGKVIEFKADYLKAEPEEDTMAGVMDILVKVFGTIIGLLFYSNEYGSAATEVGMQIMSDLLGDLFA